MYPLGWFSTGRDKAARDLLTAAYNKVTQREIDAEIAFVFCNREPGESTQSDRFLQLVDDYHIPVICLSYQKYKTEYGTPTPESPVGLPQWRLDYDREVMKRLEDYSPELCVLAGYMLITGYEICHRYNMINLHPAMPGGPAGTWQEVIEQLINNQAVQTGVMMHLVTPELDKGPVVTYCTFSIRGEPFDSYWQKMTELPDNNSRKQAAREGLFRLIRRHGLAREFPLIISTLKAFGQDKVSITPDKQVIDADGKVINGYDLTDEIEQELDDINL